MNISNDVFIRTTQEEHKKAVQHLWNVMTEKGFIYLGTYEGWYSVRDECFYSESELINGKAPTGADVEWVAKEPSYFFKLSAFQDRLLEYYDQHPDFIAPSTRKNEVVSFVKTGLRDLSISRTSFQWGVPVPGDANHVMYVWIDALTNYISALGYPQQDGDMSKFWPASLHVVGKDILRFHAVYWPAMLMAADLPVPKRLFAHGWWTKDGEKISKSLGNVIDPVELVNEVNNMTCRRQAWCCQSLLKCGLLLRLDSHAISLTFYVFHTQFGVDQTRFFLIAEVGFGNDGDFSEKAFIQRVNVNLANELGNLCQRTLSMVYKNCDQKVPIPGEFTKEDEEILESARGLHDRAGFYVSNQGLHRYAETMIGMVGETNRYIDSMEPWSLRKTDTARMGTVLYVIMEVLRHVAILYQPIIPTSANKILDLLQVSPEERTFAHLTPEFSIREGVSISKPTGVFPRIEVEEKVEA